MNYYLTQTSGVQTMSFLKNLFNKKPGSSSNVSKSATQQSATPLNPSEQGSSKPTNPLDKFLQSMKIGYMEWHEGIGYDLNALRELSPDELKQIESLLIAHKDRDWRDVE